MLRILPTPREVVESGEVLDARRLTLPGDCPFHRDVVLELWSECGGLPDGRNGAVVFRRAAELGEEAYTLSIGQDGARIGHSTPRGAYYGFVTLCELIKAHGDRVPCAEIQDEPYLPLRGVTDDISRGQISTLENFKSIVKRLSFFKMNIYMPYIEDVFRFQSEPDIGKYSDPVPAAEWRELCAYAKKHFVQVRPIFNTLGHWDRIAPLEKYRPLMVAPADANTARVLDPENPGVRPLLAKLLGEVVDAFGRGLIHVGGDEPRHLTEGRGPEKAGRLFTDHYRWMHGELKKLGCDMMLYADMFAFPIKTNYTVGLDAARGLPTDIKMMYWDYDPSRDHSGVNDLMDLGFETCISPSTATCGRLTPDTRMSYENSIGLERAAPGRAAGIMISSWGDGMDCPREMVWHGYAGAAEAGWSREPASYERFMRNFHGQFFGFGERLDLSALEPVYGSDGFFGAAGFMERRRLWQAFWKDARQPHDEGLKDHAESALAALETAHRYMAGLSPRFNEECWACIVYGASRLEWTARKLQSQVTGPYRSREQARATVPRIRACAESCRSLLEEARTRWFASNRQSQWGYVESAFLDLIASLESLARYCAHKPSYPSAEKYLCK